MRVTGRWVAAAAVLGAALVAGCSSTPNHAPVSDASAINASGVNPATLPGAENAGKPGYYTVQKGDTLYAIASRYGQSASDLIRWNPQLANPNVIEVGQVLRVVPPEGGSVTASAAPPAVASVPSSPAPTVATQTTPGVTPAPAASAAPAAAPAASSNSIQLAWPAKGQVITAFNGTSSKGIDIAGAAGEPVLAAADGKVIYVGSGVRGYGNLVIIQHNGTFLTAYAHNQKLLVKENQTVKKGQRIAEMGSSDADRVKLHFEVRKSGKPVDPLAYLPRR